MYVNFNNFDTQYALFITCEFEIRIDQMYTQVVISIIQIIFRMKQANRIAQ